MFGPSLAGCALFRFQPIC